MPHLTKLTVVRQIKFAYFQKAPMLSKTTQTGLELFFCQGIQHKVDTCNERRSNIIKLNSVESLPLFYSDPFCLQKVQIFNVAQLTKEGKIILSSNLFHW